MAGAHTRTHESGRVFDLSLPACWVWDFYNLRSRIVHGDQVQAQELVFGDWITHLIVADLMFLLCMQAVLFDLRFLGDDVRQNAAELRRCFIDLCISNRHHGYKKEGRSEPMMNERMRSGRLCTFLVMRHRLAMRSSRVSGWPLASFALKWAQTHSSGLSSGA